MDWDALGRFPGTLVLYMGVARLGGIAERLVAAGRSADEPAAIVERGTLPGQRTVTGSLGDLAERAADAGIRPPAVTVVGPVARLRDTLGWLERRPLWGRTVAVTRARAQAGGLAARLRDLGAAVIEAPAIRIVPRPVAGDVERACRAISEYDLVCLTSPNGATLLMDALAATGRDARALAGVTVAAIGPATARELAARGVIADHVPERAVAEELLAALAEVDVDGRRVLVARAAEARDVLPETLRSRGADVDVVALYDTVAERLSDGELAALADADYVTFTSSSTVRNLMGALHGPLPESARVVTIGPVTSSTAREHGLEVHAEATRHDVDGLVETLVHDAARGAPLIVTLLTDYGTDDEFAGVCHGVIRSICPECTVLDVTHGIRRHSIRHGAVVLRNALPYMPAGVHVAVVDPEVGTERRALALRCDDGRVLVGPDNGVLAPAAERFGGVVDAVDVSRSPHRLEPVSATFHGRDIFCPVAAQLARGAELADAGERIDPGDVMTLDLPAPSVAQGALSAHALRHRPVRQRRPRRRSRGARGQRSGPRPERGGTGAGKAPRSRVRPQLRRRRCRHPARVRGCLPDARAGGEQGRRGRPPRRGSRRRDTARTAVSPAGSRGAWPVARSGIRTCIIASSTRPTSAPRRSASAAPPTAPWSRRAPRPRGAGARVEAGSRRRAERCLPPWWSGHSTSTTSCCRSPRRSPSAMRARPRRR